MKNFRQFAGILVLLFFVSACAATPFKTAEKYNLDGQLEPVTEILRYNLMSWEAIDSQSFILQTAPSRFYLIVLIRPANQLMFAETISVSNTGAMVKPGYDKVTVYSSPYNETYVISKIYKLEDRDQANAIKKQLGGK